MDFPAINTSYEHVNNFINELAPISSKVSGISKREIFDIPLNA